MKSGTTRPLLGGKVNFPLTLAPMVGLSHVVLRQLIRAYLPTGAVTFWPTEMLNSRKIPHEKLGHTPETLRGHGESELVPQILGNDESSIQRSVEKLVDWGAEAIDINMGCPVTKALRHNYGVALMGDPSYAAEVVRLTVRHSPIPVSVKLRAIERQTSSQHLIDFVRPLFEEGASWVTLHPRTAAQKRRGWADWSQIRELREGVSGPVVGNGDIQTCEDVLAMMRETSCDAVMAGRALAARPWMMWQLGERLGWPPPPGVRGFAPQTPEEEGREYGVNLQRFLDCAGKFFLPFGEDLVLRKFRFYLRTTAVWLPFGQTLVSISTRGKSVAEIREGLREFFSAPVEMSPRTELRQ
ncbi:MAG: nitrogen fixation protein NifR [Bdellovibrio sp.]|nr:MAG: nitrogen fixation protein NifR [Bdellovibrio sp.]